MRAVKDRVIVRADNAETKSKGGIIIPDTVEQRDHSGVVWSVGPDVKQTKVGDRVLYNVYSELIRVDGIRYRVVKEENILTLLTKNEKGSVAKKDSEGKTRWEDLD